MACYGFRCRDCKSEFELADLEADKIKEAFCIECRGERLELVKYDDSENAMLGWIGAELKRLNEKIERILQLFEDRDDFTPPKGELN